MKQFLSWCKMMFTQKSGRVHLGKETPEAPEIISNVLPSLQVEENTIFLNRREAAFINKELHRLLKAKVNQEERRRKKGVPTPPAPGKITYAVYQ